jgi:hypothetical protein
MAAVYLLTFVMVYIIACVIDVLAPRFGGQKNFSNALKLSVYSHRRCGWRHFSADPA